MNERPNPTSSCLDASGIEPCRFQRRTAHAARPTHDPLTTRVVCTALGLLLLATPRGAPAAAYFVNASSSACSDSAAGTSDVPFCSISAALAAHHQPGDTLYVQPGTYREQVTVPASGTPDGQIALLAQPAPGAPVVIDGADDFSSPAQWSPAGPQVFVAGAVTWRPVQVFVDGLPLRASTAPISSLPPGTFEFVSGSGLYLAPPDGSLAHTILVGHRPYGLYVSARAFVVVDGFTVQHAEDRGFQLTDGAYHVQVTNNTIQRSGRFGLQARGCVALHIARNTIHDNADHGISLTAGTTRCVVEHNECYRNVFPSLREANGIWVFGSPKNLIRENRLHDNQDTGLQIQNAADSNLCVQNQSWNNGDHGYDHLYTSGNVHIGDVAYHNFRDGFSIEGNAFGQTLTDCIATDNGLTTNEYDLWVDDSSSVAFTSDYNLFWNSTSQVPVKYQLTRYGSVADYAAASGHDQHTLQADPRFASPDSGDFHLLGDSPAIDDADSSRPDWPMTDADGHMRVDDPQIANSGIGPWPWGDRGAYEFVPAPLQYRSPPRVGPGTGGGAPAAAATRGESATATLQPGVTPNPVRGSGWLSFVLMRPGPVTARVFGVDGRLVRTLLRGESLSAGPHAVAWSSRDDRGLPLPEGVYLWEVATPEGRRSGRVVVLHR